MNGCQQFLQFQCQQWNHTSLKIDVLSRNYLPLYKKSNVLRLSCCSMHKKFGGRTTECYFSISGESSCFFSSLFRYLFSYRPTEDVRTWYCIRTSVTHSPRQHVGRVLFLPRSAAICASINGTDNGKMKSIY